MQKRDLGNSKAAINTALQVSALGLGCMGLTWAYGVVDRQQGINTIHSAIEKGINFFDTADVYGPYTNEELVAEAIGGKRDKLIIATKFGLVRGLDNNNGNKTVNGSPNYVKSACEASLKRLKTDYIDLYYMHRLDRDVPIEDTVGAMKDLVDEGKVRHIGLSEVSAATLRRAHKVHPLTALQSEYSLWTRDIETNGVMDTCKELGIGIVPYAPLGRGFLTGSIKTQADFADNDYRKHSPRFQGENFNKNLLVVEKLKEYAIKLGITPAQLALAWVLAQGDHIVPIFGTTKPERLNENLHALDIQLDSTIWQEISAILPPAQGARYPDYSSHEIDS
ncbi:aldo/keto reductase [Bartonella sp. HY038]|uniref:aldo/keto reductase n=1 Tax=Bartonella sp. HY038 TaxID=2759660 RepID=UPI0015FD6275|nr:aldo/keto reductase [Bartonella sp. HY038]